MTQNSGDGRHFLNLFTWRRHRCFSRHSVGVLVAVLSAALLWTAPPVRAAGTLPSIRFFAAWAENRAGFSGPRLFLHVQVDAADGQGPLTIQSVVVTAPDGRTFDLTHHNIRREYSLDAGTPIPTGTYSVAVTDTQGNTVTAADTLNPFPSLLPPNTTLPEPEQTLTTTTPTFRWDPVAKAGSGRVRLCKAETLNTCRETVYFGPFLSGTAAEFALPAGVLEPGRRYVLRLEAHDTPGGIPGANIRATSFRPFSVAGPDVQPLANHAAVRTSQTPRPGTTVRHDNPSAPLLTSAFGGTPPRSRLALEVHAPQKINLVVGKSIVIDSPISVKRVSLAAPEIADTIVLSPQQIYLVGKAVGTTNLTLWGGDDRLFTVVDLEVSLDVSGLKGKLHVILPGENIRVMAAHDAITLSGGVSSTAKLSQALALAEAHAPKKVINMLEVAGIHQVMLEVRVAEMSRSLLRRLGINFTHATRSGDFGMSLLHNLSAVVKPSDAILFPTRVPADAPFGMGLSAALNALFRLHKGDNTWTGFIDALKENGLLKVLAEPTLVALSGQTANFLAGGEFPIPVPQERGVITIIFKTFGVGLAFTPTVFNHNRIGMTVTPEVSELDFSNALAVAGFLVPAITTRRASTVIELADGQSFAIAGLLRENVREVISKFPVLGDIPILGALFRSSSFQKNETELIIIVTPRLVKPLDIAQQTLPTDQYIEPTDVEFYLMGKPEGQGAGTVKPKRLRPGVPDKHGGLDGQFGYMIP